VVLPTAARHALLVSAAQALGFVALVRTFSCLIKYVILFS
jgi:hypothetical protein